MPEDWREVGRAFAAALLDLVGANPWSRLPNSKFRTVDAARRAIVAELKRRREHTRPRP